MTADGSGGAVFVAEPTTGRSPPLTAGRVGAASCAASDGRAGAARRASLAAQTGVHRNGRVCMRVRARRTTMPHRSARMIVHVISIVRRGRCNAPGTRPAQIARSTETLRTTCHCKVRRRQPVRRRPATRRCHVWTPRPASSNRTLVVMSRSASHTRSTRRRAHHGRRRRRSCCRLSRHIRMPCRRSQQRLFRRFPLFTRLLVGPAEPGSDGGDKGRSWFGFCATALLTSLRCH